MSFDSFEYVLVFLPIVLLLYHFARSNKFLSNLIILFASYFFYAWGHAWVVLLLIFTSVTDYYIGRSIYRSKTEKSRKHLLIFSCMLNIGLLVIFKYAGWVTTSLHKSFEFIPIVFLPLPHGISFYTFQSLSYTIDIYRRRLKPKGHIIDYLSFVSFFPHLVAGPILKAVNILPQLEHVRPKVHPRVAEKAIFMICWGLFKKLVCADNLGHLVSLSKDNLDKPGAGLILLLAFTFQIYCDFSAYSDIARGTARLFGIKIPRNFLTPYFSRNPSEFWERWHISLSQWVREYIYFPLGGNRRGKARNVANVLFTMFLMGLWHGAGKYFIIWGLYHGLLLILYRVFPIDRYLINKLGKVWGRITATFIMFSFTVYGWLLFWVKSKSDYKAIKKSIFELRYLITDPEKMQTMFCDLSYGLLLFTLPIIITEIIGFRYKREFVDVHKFMRLPVKIILFIMIFFGISFFGSRGNYDFIYFQF